jgi:hypothetical protein
MCLRGIQPPQLLRTALITKMRATPVSNGLKPRTTSQRPIPTETKSSTAVPTTIILDMSVRPQLPGSNECRTTQFSTILELEQA